MVGVYCDNKDPMPGFVFVFEILGFGLALHGCGKCELKWVFYSKYLQPQPRGSDSHTGERKSL